MAIITTAFNEGPRIESRIENLLSQDYEGTLLVVPVSDGSTDDTAKRLLRFGGSSAVHPVVFDSNRGKTAALMSAVHEVPGQFKILLFGDANAQWEPSVARLLTRHFQDARVGMVAGRLAYCDDGGESRYRSWEERLKESEADVRTCIGAEGSVFAIRRDLIPDLDPSLVEDFGFTLEVLRRGYVCAYEPEAVSREEFGLEGAAEVRRRARIVNRGIRTLWVYRSLLFGRGGGPTVAWMLWSHKVLRWALPFVGLAWFLSLGFLLVTHVPTAVLVVAAGGGVATFLSVGRLRRSTAVVVQGLSGVFLGVVSVGLGRRAVRWVPVRGKGES